MRQTAIALLALVLCGFLSACNTVKGAGQDIQRGGAAIERAADQ